MFLVRRPSPQTIERFLQESRELPLSYGKPGILERAAVRGRHDQVLSPIGRGAADFEHARAGLSSWAHFELGWVQLFPAAAPVAVGTVVAVLIRHLGFWSLNGCRITSVRGDDPWRFGFSYGTLPNHAEAGEELFEVFLDTASDQVMYHIRAMSWPYAMLAHLGQPLVRVLQERFRRDSIAAMRRLMRDPIG